MSEGTKRTATVQAYVELLAEDPEATSALAIARGRLAAGRRLRSVRRVRVFELSGPLPSRGETAALLHRSTRFYNPAKERCTVRAAEREPAPFQGEEALVLVVDRGLERRPAGERWWKHETGEKVEVREGTVWALAFEPGEDAAARAGELAEVRDRHHGLFANPHFQDWRAGKGALPPWPWLERPRKRAKEDRP
jgi:hypothetical protein